MSDSVKKYYESRTDDNNWQYMPESNTNTFSDVKLNHESNKRKEYPMYSGLLKYFPNALKYVSYVSKKGNDQHHPDKPLHWDKNKSFDEPDALVRHLTDHSVNPIDEDGLYHLGKVAWRSLAMLERYLEENGL